MGVCPLYVGKSDTAIFFASELKALIGNCKEIDPFPPGCYFTFNTGLVNYYTPLWGQPSYIPEKKVCFNLLRQKLEESVVKRLMTDVPYGVLLSGGLDSSLIASIVSRHSKMRIESNETEKAWWPQVHTFSIGLPDSPDCQFAQQVATFLGTIHHNFNFTIEEGLDSIKDVIYHLETYDVTSIRASTPMFLLARKIKAMGIKMVFELFFLFDFFFLFLSIPK